MNWSDYFAMGGYGAFVWPSYGAAVLLLAALFLLSARRLRAAERALKADTADKDLPGGDT
jgi:heme exporter protein D